MGTLANLDLTPNTGLEGTSDVEQRLPVHGINSRRVILSYVKPLCIGESGVTHRMIFHLFWAHHVRL